MKEVPQGWTAAHLQVIRAVHECRLPISKTKGWVTADQVAERLSWDGPRVVNLLLDLVAWGFSEKDMQPGKRNAIRLTYFNLTGKATEYGFIPRIVNV
jgi:hypothetical protein